MDRRDVYASFNRGRISPLALARTDVSRVAMSAEVQTNWVPRVLGSMALRPGLEYIGECAAGSGALLPFIAAKDDVAILEMNGSAMRVWDNGTDLVTRPAVTASVGNDTFTDNLNGWTDADEAGATSSHDATNGYLKLVGTGYRAAKRYQDVTINETGTLHSLRIVIAQGPVLFRVGSSLGDDDVFRQAILREGTHSLAFTPSVGTIYIEFSSSLTYPVLVDSCQFDSSGILTLPTPYDADQCKLVRWQQSADVIFLGCDGLQQRRIERRTDNSWSVVLYQANDGPFLTENTDDTVRLTPSGLEGEITVTAAQSTFRAEHVGCLFSLTASSQYVNTAISSEDTWSNSIRVTGVDNNREFTINISGNGGSTVSLQRSVGEEGSWVTVRTWTGNATSETYDDNLDNQIVFYRLGIALDQYGGSTVTVTLDYANGSGTGVVRVVGFTSATEVDAIVLEPLSGLDATEIWSEGAWSDVSGWPQVPVLWEGRLMWSGLGINDMSASDALSAFSPDIVGDSAPIRRRSGEGAVAISHWALPLQRLVVGTDSAEQVVKSTSFDEPITPSNYNVKAESTKGSYPAPATVLDNSGYFIDRTGTKIFELSYDAALYRFVPLDLTALVPEAGEIGFVRVGAQQSPDKRVHAIRTDGTVALLIRDEAEDVRCLVDIETDGEIEDVVVLPGTSEDRVFYRVKRVIDGTTVYYLERWALEREARGEAMNKQADSLVTGTGLVTGLDHLEGETVVVWADGLDIGDFVVTSGAVSAGPYTTWMAGLSYQARFKSAKMAGQTQKGLALTQRSRVNEAGFILANTHYQGLRYGPDFDTMDEMPLVEDGYDVPAGTVWDSYDKGPVEFPGEWLVDGRICLEATAPRACTVLAVVASVDRQDHT